MSKPQFSFVCCYTCVMEPPGLVEEMRGGGSGIVRGLTAASLPPSCGRPGRELWPACWNAGKQEALWAWDLNVRFLAWVVSWGISASRCRGFAQSSHNMINILKFRLVNNKDRTEWRTHSWSGANAGHGWSWPCLVGTWGRGRELGDPS